MLKSISVINNTKSFVLQVYNISIFSFTESKRMARYHETNASAIIHPSTARRAHQKTNPISPSTPRNNQTRLHTRTWTYKIRKCCSKMATRRTIVETRRRIIRTIKRKIIYNQSRLIIITIISRRYGQMLLVTGIILFPVRSRKLVVQAMRIQPSMDRCWTITM